VSEETILSVVIVTPRMKKLKGNIREYNNEKTE